MDINQWFLLLGLFLLVMVLAEQWLKRGPISSAIVYFGFGFLLGPEGFNFVEFDILNHPKWMELATEIVVLVSLFSAGLKLQFPFRHPHWKLSALLASLTMVLTVLMLGLSVHLAFGLAWGAAILLGGILAPTDPVLASAVQVKSVKDPDRIRRALTGEAGFNDGTAFPVVMMGLTILGARWTQADVPLANWIFVDVLWAIPGGLMIGYACGWLAARLIVKTHDNETDRLVIEDFVSIGLIAASYGLAQLLSTYGFLAVFASALAFAKVEAKDSEKNEEISPALIRFSTQLERIGEIVTVIFVGFIAARLNFSGWYLFLPFLLLLLIRPVSVFFALRGRLPKKEIFIISWFGVRGIGSVYYLAYALNHGLTGEPAKIVFNVVMVTIVISIFVHGISSSPIMRFHERTK